MNLLIVEPQCSGEEHARFNAGLLMASLQGFSSFKLTFLAEYEHFLSVSSSLDVPVEELGLEHCSIEIPSRQLVDIYRIFEEAKLLLNVLKACRSDRFAGIVFCSMTKELYFLLRFAHLLALLPPTLSIFHSNLRALESPPVSRYRPGYLYSLQRLLKKRCRRNQNVILGQWAMDGLIHGHPVIAENFYSVEMPYIWAREARMAEAAKPVVFGFFGLADSGKGFLVFRALAERFSEQIKRGLAKFVLVGWVKPRDIEAFDSRWIEGIGSERLSEEEFDSRSQSLTYCLWAVDFRGSGYRQVASATILDSMSYLVPLLYPQSSVTEELSCLGYGYLDFEDLTRTVARLITDFDQARYKEQIEGCKKWRAKHSPDQVGFQLRRILGPRLTQNPQRY